jgi:hypothetical protein
MSPDTKAMLLPHWLLQNSNIAAARNSSGLAKAASNAALGTFQENAHCPFASRGA